MIIPVGLLRCGRAAKKQAAAPIRGGHLFAGDGAASACGAGPYERAGLVVGVVAGR